MVGIPMTHFSSWQRTGGMTCLAITQRRPSWDLTLLVLTAGELWQYLRYQQAIDGCPFYELSPSLSSRETFQL
jgi:hypothetical protein